LSAPPPDEELLVPTTITNPIAEFHLVGDADDPDGVEAVTTFYGEDGVQVEMRFTRRGLSGALAALLLECEMDLQVGQTKGIMEVVARKGEQPADEEPLTVHQILEVPQAEPSELPIPPGLTPERLDEARRRGMERDDRWMTDRPDDIEGDCG